MYLIMIRTKVKLSVVLFLKKEIMMDLFALKSKVEVRFSICNSGETAVTVGKIAIALTALALLD